MKLTEKEKLVIEAMRMNEDIIVNISLHRCTLQDAIDLTRVGNKKVEAIQADNSTKWLNTEPCQGLSITGFYK